MAYDIYELVTLYEITCYNLPDGKEDFFAELTEKAARLLGVCRMALFLKKGETMECLGYWGFKNERKALEYFQKQDQKTFTYSFAGGTGILYMEKQDPLTARDKKLYGIFARRVEDFARKIVAEKDLRKMEERNRSIVEAIPDLLFRCRVDGTYLDICCKDELILHSPPDKVTGKKIKDVLPGEVARLFNLNMRKALRNGRPKAFEYSLPVPDGGNRYFEARLVRSGDDEVIAFIRDITDLKLAEAERNRSVEQKIRFQATLLELARLKKDTLEEALRSITEICALALEVERVGIWLFRESCEEARCAELYIRSENKHTNGHTIRLKAHPAYCRAVENSRAVAVDDVAGERRIEKFGQKQLDSLGVVSLIDAPIWLCGEMAGMIGFEHTGEKRKWTEEEQQFAASVAETVSLTLETFARKKDREILEKREKRLRLITENMLDMVSEVDTKGLFSYTSPTYTRVLGYKPRELMGKPFYHLVHPEDRKKISDAVEDAINTRVPGRVEYRHRHANGGYLWVETAVNLITDNNNNIAGVVLGTRDITERKTAEEELKNTVLRLRLTIAGIIRAMEKTVEIRDPYTAGHQQRVSELATAIAREMGIPEEGIRLAASIHDLGKITVPAEILAKPGKISDMEISLIRMHPTVGYDILNKIDFPWPIATIVHQHHERLDGSGYPCGLKGEEILPEARILGVADVVEAMASHRPYRPALGLKQALQEIVAGSGTLYDPQVVKACLAVFDKNDFWL